MIRSWIFILCSALAVSCGEKNAEKHLKTEKTPAEKKDSTHIAPKTTAAVTEKQEKSDEVFLEEKDFRKVEPALTEISEADYKRLLKSASKKKCSKAEDFFKSCGLKIKSECGDICDTYLVESSGRKMLLPSGYDQGIMDLDISLSCDKFLVFSSYDGPDYVDYYEDRSEIMSYRINGKNGLKDIKPYFEIYFKDWSISEAKWIDDRSLALKLYSEGNNQAAFHYFRAAVK